ncbi:fibrobacter succinogenes major paralogous domain-containing protein [bacterium]|nr:fibrobacter succinogenes major paralogous domain-containing protein [bacterium]
MFKRKAFLIVAILYLAYLPLFSQDQTGTMEGNDGKVYKTIKIGSQWWMAENLKETKYQDGSTIHNVTNNTTWAARSSGAYCAYKNDENIAQIYGYLYNWYAVNGSGDIAPKGWRVPTDADWKVLEMYLGMEKTEAIINGNRGTDEGGKLKETGTIHWASPNIGATNKSGFSVLPSGLRDDASGTFWHLGSNAYFWTPRKISATNAPYRNIRSSCSTIYRTYRGRKRSGYSIRLVRD